MTYIKSVQDTIITVTRTSHVCLVCQCLPKWPMWPICHLYCWVLIKLVIVKRKQCWLNWDTIDGFLCQSPKVWTLFDLPTLCLRLGNWSWWDHNSGKDRGHGWKKPMFKNQGASFTFWGQSWTLWPFSHLWFWVQTVSICRATNNVNQNLLEKLFYAFQWMAFVQSTAAWSATQRNQFNLRRCRYPCSIVSGCAFCRNVFKYGDIV